MPSVAPTENQPIHPPDSDCPNCGAVVRERYCPQCGQRRGARRISWSMIIQGLLGGLTNVERGFWYNIKSLTLTPGKAINGYLDGRWATFYHPLKYAVVGITLITLVSNQFGTQPPGLGSTEKVAKETPIMADGYQIGYAYGKVLRRNQKFLWITNVFFFALPFALFHRQRRFPEWMTINAFILGHVGVLTSLLFWILPWNFLINPIFWGLLWLYYFLYLRRSESVGMSILVTTLGLMFGLILFVMIPALLFYFGQELFGLN